MVVHHATSLTLDHSSVQVHLGNEELDGLEVRDGRVAPFGSVVVHLQFLSLRWTPLGREREWVGVTPYIYIMHPWVAAV